MLRTFSIAGLFATALAAQTSNQQSVTLRFANADSAGTIQEAANIARTLADIPDVSFNTDQKTVTVAGTAVQNGVVQWAAEQLDKPAGWKAPAPVVSYEYAATGKDAANSAVRIFYLKNLLTPADRQEVINSLRTGVDLPRVMPFTQINAIVVRGTSDQIAGAEWLVQQLDQPVQAARPTASYTYRPPQGYPIGSTTDVRIFYLQHTPTPVGVQEMMNVLRTGADIMRVFPLNSRSAIVVRGEPAQVTLGAWLVQQLDQQPDKAQSAASYTYESPDRPSPDDVNSAVRVVYVQHLTASAAASMMQPLRELGQINRLFYNTTAKAFTMRGPASGVALAEQRIVEADKAAQ